MLDKERALAIPRLNFSAIVETLDAAALLRYNDALRSFVDRFQGQESDLKSALDAKNPEALASTLAAIKDALTQLRADGLAAESQHWLDALPGAAFESLEAGLVGFLASLSTLSIDIQMAGYKATGAEAGPGLGRSGEGSGILAVDDVPFFLASLKRMLEGTGHKTICVTSSQAAMQFLHRHTPRLIILDIEMPGMSGYELARKIRESGWKAPIVFLTGNSKKENVLKAIQAGGVDFIVKPVNQREMLARIEKYLQ